MYAKNYLPILFNLYTAEEKEGDPDKLPVLETVRIYLSISDPKVSIPVFICPYQIPRLVSLCLFVHTKVSISVFICPYQIPRLVSLCLSVYIRSQC